jgi:hypothetical protein
MIRKVFYSFHFDNDCQRVSQVRNIGHLEDNKPMKDNSWEEIKKKGDAAVEKWIADELSGRSCTVVLIGSQTADRKWVKHEIQQSWKLGKGVVGVHIYGLQNLAGEKSTKGSNPFEKFTIENGSKKLSSQIKVYDPTVSSSSKATYANIANNLAEWIEEAITIRKDYAAAK